MNAWIVLPGLVGLAVLFVMLPVGLAVFSHYRTRKLVRCPVDGTDAAILIDAPQAGVAAAFGRRSLVVRACSSWPEQGRCGRTCLAAGEEAMREAQTPA